MRGGKKEACVLCLNLTLTFGEQKEKMTKIESAQWFQQLNCHPVLFNSSDATTHTLATKDRRTRCKENCKNGALELCTGLFRIFLFNLFFCLIVFVNHFDVLFFFNNCFLYSTEFNKSYCVSAASVLIKFCGGAISCETEEQRIN